MESIFLRMFIILFIIFLVGIVILIRDTNRIMNDKLSKDDNPENPLDKLCYRQCVNCDYCKYRLHYENNENSGILNTNSFDDFVED